MWEVLASSENVIGKIHFFVKMVIFAEFLGNDSTSACVFLFDHVCMQVLNHKTKKNMWKCCHQDIIDLKIPPNNYFPK